MRKGSSLFDEKVIQMSIRFPISMMEKIRTEAKNNRLSVNQQVIKLVQSGLDNLENFGEAEKDLSQ